MFGLGVLVPDNSARLQPSLGLLFKDSRLVRVVCVSWQLVTEKDLGYSGAMHETPCQASLCSIPDAGREHMAAEVAEDVMQS